MAPVQKNARSNNRIKQIEMELDSRRAPDEGNNLKRPSQSVLFEYILI